MIGALVERVSVGWRRSWASSAGAWAIAGGTIDPRNQDYFVIKPQFSGFYSTNLGVLLPKLGVRRLILTGVATEICVLFTAADAHMRDAMGVETAATDQLALNSWRP